jgi:hypothetical protein
MSALPPVDVVVCFGLLYHLENPFSVVRALRALTKRVLIVETQLIPEASPGFRLVEEGQNITQGLSFHAAIPTRTGLLKMLYVSGFKRIWRYVGDVDHDDFRDTRERIHRREIFVASDLELAGKDLQREPEPSAPKYDFARPA